MTAFSPGYVKRKISASSSQLSVRNSLAEKARARLQILAAERTDRCIEKPGLVDWVAVKWPELHRFEYFAPYAETIQRAVGGDLRIAFAAPPQHGKTVFTLRAFLYLAEFFPGKRHAYVTYNDTRAKTVAKEFRAIARAAGFVVTGTLQEAVVNGTTTIKFTSVKGGLTGYALDGLCVVDDPIKDIKDAYSTVAREDTIRWWKTSARTRRHAGTSFIVMATRWHPDDLSGHLIREEDWRYINLKAIAEPASNDDVDDEGRLKSDPLHRFPGESLHPRLKPPAFFDEERRDAFTWASMYQGEPSPVGGEFFREPGSVDAAGEPNGPLWYAELPKDSYRGAFGLDLAYTAKTHADWSICVEAISVGKKLYIVDVLRKQVDGAGFALALKSKSALRPGWPMRWYIGGTEKPVADFMRRSGILVKAIPAVADKRVRALGVAAAWNRGDVLLPDPEAPAFKGRVPWLAPFLGCIQSFTGNDDAHDDDVDALAAAFDQLMKRNPMVEALERRIQGNKQ